jgi:hypothetical protein
MRFSNLLRLWLALGLTVTVPAALAGRAPNHWGNTREYLSSIVDQVLDSIENHNPHVLPLATIYKATENSHASSLAMMTAWRTITKVNPPSLLAIDTQQGSVYVSSVASEGNSKTKSILRGRIKVVDREITEVELFISRSRGDDGFGFSADQHDTNNRELMSPPPNRTRASRETLEILGEGMFDASVDFPVTVSNNCQFTEVGWIVVDTGTYGNASSDPLACSWRTDRPTDLYARNNLVVDEELGFVVCSGMVPGMVYPYIGNISTFIPDDLPAQQEAQVVWIEEMKAQGGVSMVSPRPAMGDNLQVIQYYNDELTALQLNVYLFGPNMTSPWLY